MKSRHCSMLMQFLTFFRISRLLKYVGFAMLLSLAGCASEVQLKPNPQSVMGEQVHAADPLPYYDGRYQLAPGDEIEVIYHINKQLQGEYFIAIGDQIRVEFFSYPQFDRTLNVRPDGMITLPYMGDLMAVGKTPMQLTADIDELYSELMTRPRSSVSLIRYGERIRELTESIKTSQRGQSRLALVQQPLRPGACGQRVLGGSPTARNQELGRTQVKRMCVFSVRRLRTVTSRGTFTETRAYVQAISRRGASAPE